MATSQRSLFTKLQQSAANGASKTYQGAEAIDSLNVDEAEVKSVGAAPNDLVNIGVDMSQLSDYMDNIIKVVN